VKNAHGFSRFLLAKRNNKCLHFAEQGSEGQGEILGREQDKMGKIGASEGLIL